MPKSFTPSGRPADLNQLLQLWQHRRAGRAMPARPDITVEDLRPWLGRLLLLDVIEGGRDFRYRVYGSAVANYLGAERNGQMVTSLPPELRDILLDEYRTVVTMRVPREIHSDRRVGNNQRQVTKLILPLSADGGTVNMLLVGVAADGLR